MAVVALTAAPHASRRSAAAEPLLSAEAPSAERDPLSGMRGPRFLEPNAQAALDTVLQTAVEKKKAGYLLSFARCAVSEHVTVSLPFYSP